MGDGTVWNPYTREDVLKLIAGNGGKAEYLNLSEKWFERRIALTELDLKGVILEDAHLEGVCLIGANLKGAFLHNAHLEGANLSGAHLNDAFSVSVHLEKAELFGAHLEGTEFFGAHFEEANLIDAFLDGTRLNGAHLNGVCMRAAKFTSNTQMHAIDWGDFILGEEKEWEKNKKEIYLIKDAEDIYRRLKQWYTNAGMYDVAGKFYYREMESKRKTAQELIREQFKDSKVWQFFKFLFRERGFVGDWIRLWIYRLTCGYGEKPERAVISASVIIFGLALVYFAIGTLIPNSFLDCLYYSFVSFTAVGYGAWAKESSGWVKWLGVLETILGVFMMALFLVTFTRKMTR